MTQTAITTPPPGEQPKFLWSQHTSSLPHARLESNFLLSKERWWLVVFFQVSMHLYPAAERQTFLSVLTAQLPCDLLFSWREVFTREVFLQHWSKQTHGQRHEGSSPSTWAPVPLSYREEDERGCALLKHRSWPGFRKALKHMLKPSPFLRRDVFVARAPSSTAAGLVCRGAVGEQGTGYLYGAGAIAALYPVLQGTQVLSAALAR